MPPTATRTPRLKTARLLRVGATVENLLAFGGAGRRRDVRAGLVGRIAVRSYLAASGSAADLLVGSAAGRLRAERAAGSTGYSTSCSSCSSGGSSGSRSSCSGSRSSRRSVGSRSSDARLVVGADQIIAALFGTIIITVAFLGLFPFFGAILKVTRSSSSSEEGIVGIDAGGQHGRGDQPKNEIGKVHFDFCLLCVRVLNYVSLLYCRSVDDCEK